MTKKTNLLAVFTCVFGVAIAAAVSTGSAGEAGGCGAKMAGESCAATAKVAKAKSEGGCPMSAKLAAQNEGQGEVKVTPAVLSADDAAKSAAACSMSKTAKTASTCSVDMAAKMAAGCDKEDCDMSAKKAKMAAAGCDMADKPCGAEKGLMALTITEDGAWHLNNQKVQPEELQKKLAAGLEENPETRLSVEVKGASEEQVQALLDFLKEQKIQTVSVKKEDAEPAEIKLTQVTQN